jgi:hypothetical protein
LNGRRISKDPENASLIPHRCTNYRKARRKRRITTHTRKKCKKDPAQSEKTRSGPSGIHLATDEVAAATAITPPPGIRTTWGGATSRAHATLKQRSGCPTPIRSGRGEWNHAAPCRRRRAPTMKATASAYDVPKPDSTIEPEEAAEENRQPESTGIDEEEEVSTTARSPPPSPASTTAGRGKSKLRRQTSAPPFLAATAGQGERRRYISSRQTPAPRRLIEGGTRPYSQRTDKEERLPSTPTTGADRDHRPPIAQHWIRPKN